MNGRTMKSDGSPDGNTRMSCEINGMKDGSGCWLDFYECGHTEPCAAFYLSVPEMRALAEYLDGCASEVLKCRRRVASVDQTHMEDYE